MLRVVEVIMYAYGATMNQRQVLLSMVYHLLSMNPGLDVRAASDYVAKLCSLPLTVVSDAVRDLNWSFEQVRFFKSFAKICHLTSVIYNYYIGRPSPLSGIPRFIQRH